MKKSLMKNPDRSNLLTLLILLLVIGVFLGLVVGKSMYSQARLTLLASQIPEFGLIAIGMTLAFLMGGIDLSLVVNANLAGILAAYVLSKAWFPGLSDSGSILVGVLVAICAAMICGLLNGVLIAKFSVPPMIATLSTMTFFTGIAMALTSGESVIGFPKAFTDFGMANLGSVPVIFIIFVILVVLISLFLSKTKFGRRIYLYGANPVASRFSAINNERLIILVYMFNGLLAGLSGLTIISRVTTAKVGYGDAYLVQAMLVAIIGGVNPNGGRGKLAGVMIAILITQFLASAFTIWQLSPYNRKLIWGVLLIAVITINHISDRRRKGRAA